MLLFHAFSDFDVSVVGQISGAAAAARASGAPDLFVPGHVGHGPCSGQWHTSHGLHPSYVGLYGFTLSLEGALARPISV